MGRSPRAAWRALIGALLALAAITTPTFASSASSVVNTGTAPLIGGFSARALDENGQVTPKTYFDITMKAGDSFDGDILVTNAATDFVRLRVDSVDGLTGQTSGTVYANRSDPRLETSRWIHPKKHALRLDAKSARTLKFHVHVPDDATPGDHVGAVAFQRILPAKKGNFAVRQVLRVAVAVQIRVEGPADAALEIGTMTLKPLGGTQIPSVNVQLKNTGQLLCRPSLTVTLSQGGNSLGTVSRQLDTILAGDTIDYPLPWKQPLDSGTYQAQASTTGCGKTDQATADLKLTTALRGSTKAPGPDSAMLKPDKGFPWWGYVLGALAALAFGYLGFFLARRSARKEAAQAAEAPPAAAAPVAPEPPAAAAPDPPEPAAPSAPAAPESVPKAVAVEPIEPPNAAAIEPEPAPPAAPEPPSPEPGASPEPGSDPPS